ncbi:hypothetical protein C8T65DRAFT_704091 [Cerioporus squamosus]|nr:hypothetical protein C8T65DRAFT_704091 [Cerioporus squamosus]
MMRPRPLAPYSIGTDAEERWRYLHRLVDHVEYLEMLHRARTKLHAFSEIEPHAAAPWLTWSYTSPHLPTFAHHDRTTLSALVSWLSNGISSLWDSPTGDVQRFCLALGMLLRDAKLVSEIVDEEHISDDLPAYFAHSRLTSEVVSQLRLVCAATFPVPRPRPASRPAAHPTLQSAGHPGTTPHFSDLNNRDEEDSNASYEDVPHEPPMFFVGDEVTDAEDIPLSPPLFVVQDSFSSPVYDTSDLPDLPADFAIGELGSLPNSSLSPLSDEDEVDPLPMAEAAFRIPC